MESLFFNLSDSGFEESFLANSKSGVIKRVAISQGLLFLNAKILKPKSIKLKYIDRMAMIVISKEGFLEIVGQEKRLKIKNGEVSIYISTKQDFELKFSKNSNCVVIFVADFFIKHYLNGNSNNIADFLYEKLQKSIVLKELLSVPLSASLNYLTNKIVQIKVKENNSILRMQIDVLELLYEIFSLLEIENLGASKEELEIIKKAQKALLKDIQNPPTIKELALICKVNESRLKKVFKKVTKKTIRKYLQEKRLEYAHILVKSQNYTMGQVARMVGFKHQYYFSQLYYSKYDK